MSAKVERLVNLTVALLEARRPMTFDEIRRRTRYYDQDDHESARRMFERDKDDLRRLGVPVETRSLDAFDVETGYIVDREDYELPDVDLTSEEVAALALALQMTGDEGARLGLAKLSARAPDPVDLSGTVPAHVEMREAPLDDVAPPLMARQAVRFTYRRADGSDAERTVDPYAVVQRRGAWYLVGRDHDRDAVRAFRLDRTTSGIAPVGEPGAFSVPADLDPSEHVSGPHEDELDVDVAIAPAARWEAELRGGVPTRAVHRPSGDDVQEAWPVYRLRATNPWRTVSWVLALGADAVVVAPEAVRAEVVAALEELAR
ncbi:MAG: WYL domain-containing protein [Actinobacteria bacterium]|nr:WYL domain-containing protein [Actinomycetota bacterium]